MSLACYKPSLQTEYTEETEWTPFDLLSRLVQEWERAGQLPDNSAKKTRQVIIRPGAFTCIQDIDFLLFVTHNALTITLQQHIHRNAFW